VNEDVRLGVKVGVAVAVLIAVFVGVPVAVAIVTVAPFAGNPLKFTVCPFVPAAPVRLKR